MFCIQSLFPPDSEICIYFIEGENHGWGRSDLVGDQGLIGCVGLYVGLLGLVERWSGLLRPVVLCDRSRIKDRGREGSG